MQLVWITFMGGYHVETRVFNIAYSIDCYRDRQAKDSWVIMGPDNHGILKTGYQTKEEAMIAVHQIIEKELETGYIRKGAFDSLPAKLSYIPEDMFGCKKALALFTNENGDEYIDSALISATIPKGSLVREVDPEHHDGLPDDLGICRKCRSDKAIIVDILEPMCEKADESTNLPSRKTQRKKIPIISVHVVTEALRKYFVAQEDLHFYESRRRMEIHKDECTITRKLISGFMSMILGCNNDARIFGEWLCKITKPQFPVSLDLAIATRLLDPYKDITVRYQDDSYMLCKVLLAKILRDIGIMDIALRQSYKIGNRIQIDNFDLDNSACGAGFHFFKTAIEAQHYTFN